jgi:hypothetical protein
MTVKMQLHLDPEVPRRARERVAQLGISLDEYVRRLMAQDLERAERKDHPPIFNLGNSSGADIAREKDSMIAEAVEATRRSKRKRR